MPNKSNVADHHHHHHHPLVVKHQDKHNMLLTHLLLLVQYDLLATAAYECGRINEKRWERGDVTESIRKDHEIRQNKTLTDLPLFCESNDWMRKLLERSIDTERTVLSDRDSNETILREHFRAFVAAN